MSMRRMRSLSLFLLTFGVVATLLSAARAGGNPANRATLRGLLTYVYAYNPTEKEITHYYLYTAPGRATQIRTDAPLGANLNGKMVTAEGEPLPSDGGVPTFLATSVQEDPTQPASDFIPAALGTVRYVNLLCKFVDVVDTPISTTYATDLMGTTYPRISHYYQRVAYGTINVVATDSYGWFTLPNTKAYYIGNPSRLTELFQDCTEAATAGVDFTQYNGVNMFVNATYGTAWGGTQYNTLDGVTKSWRVTWMTSYGQGVMAHELGHSLGLPHSSGPYGSVYDSNWDVMSGIACGDKDSAETTPIGGCAAQGTIGYHLDRLQALSGSRILTVTPGQTVTTFIERAGLPLNSNSIVLIKILIGGSGRFYTVEVRQKAGYDAALKTSGAVVIHNVDANRPEPALVVDGDSNGNPNDGGSSWTAGETFTDGITGISVAVLEAQPTGFMVRVTNNSAMTAPNVPSLISPISGSAAQTLPVFVWNRVPRADRYNLTVYSGGSPIYAGNLLDTTVCYGALCRYTYPLSALSVASPYTWTVQAVNVAGNGPVSTTGTFTVVNPLGVPTLVSPNTSISATSTTSNAFTWNAVASATHYRLQIYGVENNALGLSPLVFDQTYPAAGNCPSTCSVTVNAALLNGGKYRWVLTPINGGADGPLGTTMFSVAAPPTVAPVPVSPSGSTSINPPTFTWQPVLGASYYKVTLYPSGGGYSYWLYPASVLCEPTLCTFRLLEDAGVAPYALGNYNWDVAGAVFSGSWVYGPASSQVPFSIVAPPALTAPIPYAPNGAATGLMPTYRWNAVNGATSYILQVFQGVTEVVNKTYRTTDICVGTTCQATPFATTLTLGQTYTWKVTPQNTANGPTSATLTFVIRTRRADTIGVWRPNSYFYLRNVNSSGMPDVSTLFGLSTDTPIVGDWDGDGVETIGVFRNSAGRFYLKNWNNNSAPVAYSITFGQPGDIPVAGDWDGDGKDSIGVYRPTTQRFYLRNALISGPVDYSIGFGLAADIPLAGDWNGDGKDSPGLRRPSNSVFYLSNTACANCNAAVNYSFTFGAAGDIPFVGDWNGDGVTGVGLYRGSNTVVYLRQTPTGGPAELSFTYGQAGDRPLGGRWQAGALDPAPSFTPKR